MAVSLRPLQRVLGRWAVRGTAVLLVEVPGGWAARLAVERAMAARGWRAATSPADADALLVCGAPGEGWAEVLERTWAQLPGPRARASVVAADDVPGALDGLATSLLDDDAQRADAASRDLVAEGVEAGDDMHPAGLALAGGEDDLRDGLEMDVLRVPLGPVLPAWPAGLVVRTVLSGDVVVRAQVEVVPGAGAASADGWARRLDAAAQVLLLAGADDLAARAVRLRDTALDGPASDVAPHLSRTSAPSCHDGPPSRALGRPSAVGTDGGRRMGAFQPEVEGLRRRVERSRVLRWSLRGAGAATSPSPTEGPESDGAHASGPQDGPDVGPGARRRTGDDVHALLLRLLDPDARDDDPRRRTRAALDALPERLVGVDVVTARLLVAALDLRTDALGDDDLAALAPRDDDEHAGSGHHGHDHG